MAIFKDSKEKFKPKKKNLDNDPPIIEIAEAITVDSQAYTLKGEVKDKSKQIYLTIDGRPVEVKRGKFTLDRFNFDPEIVEEIKIVAIDKWNNRSEKIVKVTVKLEETQAVKAYEELKPNRIKVSKDDMRVTAYGEVDELNVTIGLLLFYLKKYPKIDNSEYLFTRLSSIQNELFNLGTVLAAIGSELPSNSPKINDNDILILESDIDNMNSILKPLESFILPGGDEDRKSTRLNSSHALISYAVFCLKKKKK